MPTLMLYWKSVWFDAMKPRDHRYRTHNAAEVAAFQRRLSYMRDSMPREC